MWVKNGEKIPPELSAKCRRSQINEELSMRTMRALGFYNDQNRGEKFDDEFMFLYPFKNGMKKQGKDTILYALGRIGDPEIAREMAQVICRNKFTAKDAVSYIEHEKIRRVVEFMKTHPEPTH